MTILEKIHNTFYSWQTIPLSDRKFYFLKKSQNFWPFFADRNRKKLWITLVWIADQLGIRVEIQKENVSNLMLGNIYKVLILGDKPGNFKRAFRKARENFLEKNIFKFGDFGCFKRFRHNDRLEWLSRWLPSCGLKKSSFWQCLVNQSRTKIFNNRNFNNQNFGQKLIFCSKNRNLGQKSKF